MYTILQRGKIIFKKNTCYKLYLLTECFQNIFEFFFLIISVLNRFLFIIHNKFELYLQGKHFKL